MNTAPGDTRAADQRPCLTVNQVTKRFGAVRALQGVDLTIFPGEVHAVVGENGAGKSTLMKILSGAHAPDGGSIRYQDRPFSVRSPVEARRLGVAMIYQELTLAPHLTVAQNLVLGAERSAYGFVRDPRERMREALGRLGHRDLDLDAPVWTLNIGTQQVVEIARALLGRARLIIMDEPTSSLSTADATALFEVIRGLTQRGIAVIYISHFLEEILRIADRLTVMRDGVTVGGGRLADMCLDDIVRLMVGRTLDDMFPRIPHKLGEPVLSLERVSGRVRPRDASFELRRGEILGLAGLVGSGRSETVRSAFGLHPACAGTVRIRDHSFKAVRMHPALALEHGLDLLSEDRKEEGLATDMTVRDNTCLSSLGRMARFGFVSSRVERQAAEHWRGALNIRCPDTERPVRKLSGGNQQKVALARILHHDSDILFLDEPTRGIDVGSKAEICRLIGELAAAGKAVVVVSSYLPELLGICDTLAVMYRGTLSPKRAIADWTQDSIMLYATSGRDHDTA